MKAYAVGIAIVMCFRISHAPPAAPPPPPAIAATPSTPILEPASWWAGGSMDLLIAGSIDQAAMGTGTSVDASTTVAFGGLLDYAVSPLVAIGFAPRVLIGVRPDRTYESSTQVDLRLRVTVGTNVSPRVRLYGFVAPGYSVIWEPRQMDGRRFHPHGIVAGFGGGVGVALGPRLELTSELGYQLGYQGTREYGVDVTFEDSFLHLGVGLVAAL